MFVYVYKGRGDIIVLPAAPEQPDAASGQASGETSSASRLPVGPLPRQPARQRSVVRAASAAALRKMSSIMGGALRSISRPLSPSWGGAVSGSGPLPSETSLAEALESGTTSHVNSSTVAAASRIPPVEEGRQRVERGDLFRLAGCGDFILQANSQETEDGLSVLFLAGQPLREPVFRHGPFVMNTREEVVQCFSDYQKGNLCPKPVQLASFD